MTLCSEKGWGAWAGSEWQRCFSGRMAFVALTLSIAIAALGAVGLVVPMLHTSS